MVAIVVETSCWCSAGDGCRGVGALAGDSLRRRRSCDCDAAATARNVLALIVEAAGWSRAGGARARDSDCTTTTVNWSTFIVEAAWLRNRYCRCWRAGSGTFTRVDWSAIAG